MNAGLAIAADIDERPDLRLQRRIDLVTGVVDRLQLALVRVDAVVRRLGLRRALGQHGFELHGKLVVLGRQCFNARLLVLGEGAGRGVKLVELALQIVGGRGLPRSA